MSRAIVIAGLLAFVPCAALAAGSTRPAQEPSAHELFQQGIEAYRSGDLGTARSLWEATLRSPEPVDRATVLYDLGNAAWSEQEPLLAAGYYTAALRHEPRASDLWTNLELARAKAGVEPADRGDLSSTLERLVTALTLAESQRLVLGLALLAAVALAWEALRGGRWARRGAWIALLLVALGCGPWAWQLARRGDDPLFVTAIEGAPLHSEPREDAALVGRLMPAAQVERDDALPGWVRVTADDGRRGWVRSDTVIRLARPEEPPDSPRDPATLASGS